MQFFTTVKSDNRARAGKAFIDEIRRRFILAPITTARRFIAGWHHNVHLWDQATMAHTKGARGKAMMNAITAF